MANGNLPTDTPYDAAAATSTGRVLSEDAGREMAAQTRSNFAAGIGISGLQIQLKNGQSSPAIIGTATIPTASQSAAGAMVQVCAFVVFFLTALRLLTGLTGWSHPALLGFFELTNGILRLPPTRAGFVWAAALLGWGGLSVHCQTAAVLRGAGLSLRPYLRGKALQAALSAATAAFTAQWRL